jgi:hypothetical protein
MEACKKCRNDCKCHKPKPQTTCNKEKHPGSAILFSGFFLEGAQGTAVSYYFTLGMGITNLQRPEPTTPPTPFAQLPLILPLQFYGSTSDRPPAPNDLYYRLPRAGTLRNLRISIEYTTGDGIPPSGGPPTPGTVGIWHGRSAQDDNSFQFTPPAIVETSLTAKFDLYDPRAIATKFLSYSNTVATVDIRPGDYIALVGQFTNIVSGNFTLKYLEASVEYV